MLPRRRRPVASLRLCSCPSVPANSSFTVSGLSWQNARPEIEHEMPNFEEFGTMPLPHVAPLGPPCNSLGQNRLEGKARPLVRAKAQTCEWFRAKDGCRYG